MPTEPLVNMDRVLDRKYEAVPAGTAEDPRRLEVKLETGTVLESVGTRGKEVDEMLKVEESPESPLEKVEMLSARYEVGRLLVRCKTLSELPDMMVVALEINDSEGELPAP